GATLYLQHIYAGRELLVSHHALIECTFMILSSKHNLAAVCIIALCASMAGAEDPQRRQLLPASPQIAMLIV
ncbi:MAG: hypothetical protein ACKVHE_20150, partial [Planctomycetales bacterium]